MGCWNGTCAVSNLPITCSTEVIGLAMTDVRGDDPYLYHTPLPFYVEGKYDDYGRIEDEHGPGVELLIDVFRDKAVPMAKGENEFHEHPVDPASFTWEALTQAAQEGRLKVTTHVLGKDNENNIEILMVRKDVFDMILENHQMGLRKEGMSYSHKTNYAEIMEDYDAFYRELVECYAPDEDELDLAAIVNDPNLKDPERDRALRAALNATRMLANSTFRKYDNYISMLLSNDNIHGNRNGCITAQVVITDKIKEGISSEELYPLVENAVRLRVIDAFMVHSHKQWQCPGYAGQEGNTEAHCLLASAIIGISEAMAAEYEE